MSTFSLSGAGLLAVDPVPWARAQMAFTLACHIILVPLGVSWAFMALVANWRAIKRDDEDALLLAQRWSKYMAVTFAVGAVTGTVLTFEFGLLWPKFMGTWGAAFGIPFSVEGLFFFIEAIFIALYIFGWKRLRPWPHFWTGVPIVIAGIGGTLSVVAANAWMNEPGGLHAEQRRRDHRRRSAEGDLQRGLALRGLAHAGRRLPRRRLPRRLGLRGRHAEGPPGPVPPARLPHPVHGRRDRDTDPDGGRRHARPLGLQQRADQVRGDRAGARDRQRRARDAARPPELRWRGHRRDRDPRASPRGCRTRAPARARSCRVSTRSPPTSDRRPARSTPSTWPGT